MVVHHVSPQCWQDVRKAITKEVQSFWLQRGLHKHGATECNNISAPGEDMNVRLIPSKRRRERFEESVQDAPVLTECRRTAAGRHRRGRPESNSKDATEELGAGRVPHRNRREDSRSRSGRRSRPQRAHRSLTPLKKKSSRRSPGVRDGIAHKPRRENAEERNHKTSGSGEETTKTAAHETGGSAKAATQTRRRKSGWDCVPDDDHLFEQVLVQKKLSQMNNLPVPKKRRECYVGNLAKGQVTETVLQECFCKLFHALPSYAEAYPGMPKPVCSITWPVQCQGHNGQFAFVEFLDEVLAETAMLMSGADLCGRPLRIGRPQGFVKSISDPQVQTLDVSPLKSVGLLPALNVFATLEGQRERELYFGNLMPDEVNSEVLTNLLLPVCLEMPEYDSSLGNPILRVNLNPTSSFGFVLFQSAAMATSVMEVFDSMELYGRRLKVRRPAGVGNARPDAMPLSQDFLQGLQLQPPPPPPPAEKDSPEVQVESWVTSLENSLL